MQLYTAYGCSSANQYYPEDSIPSTNKINTEHFAEENCEIDILLDLDESQLQICLVGDISKDKEFKLWGFEDENKLGWVPHFNLCDEGTALRLAEIPISWYGLPKGIDFE